MNDRLLRVTVILSVLALVGMAGAGAAAAQDFNVTNLDAPQVAPFGEDIDVTVTVENTGGSSGTANVTFAANETSPIGPGSTVTEGPITTPSLTPGENFTTTLTLNTDANYTGLTSNSTVDEIIHGVFVNNTATGTINDTAEAPLTVGTENRDGAVVVENSDTSGFPVEDANVSLYIGSVDPSNLIAENVTASSGPDNNRIRFTRAGNNPTNAASTTPPLAIGPDRNNPIEYVVRSTKQPNFQAAVRSAELHEDNVEGTLFPELQRIARPEEFDITQSAESALADGEDSITFNVSILDNLEGDRLTNEPFTVFHDGGDAVSIANGTTFQTGSDGFVEIPVSSNSSQRVMFEFVADNNETVTEIREKNFILSGEGQVIGDVWDVDSPNLRSLPDARIWAVQKDTFTQNSIQLPNTGYANAGDQSFYRVWRTEDPANFTQSDPEVDELLDITQDYRIDNNGTNENLSISRVRELNTTNSAVGSGFAVRANVNNPDNVYVTPLEPGYYYIEHSFNQRNASDQRFVNDSAPTDPFGSFGGVGDSGNDLSVELTTDLTFEATQEFSNFSGQNLTDITDENGEYVLKNMYTDFQAGVDYTVIANKAGYEIEFIDPLVTESGAFFEDGADENFGLERVEEDVDVNVTNLARLPIDPAESDEIDLGDPADPSTYEEYEFDNQTDRFPQEVPRDGRTIDVVQVDTQTESGAPINETIQLSVPDVEDDPGTRTDAFNFTGEWIEVAGGTVVDDDPVNNTITIATGSDGQAIAWLEADLDNEDLRSVVADNVNTGGQICETVEEEGPFGETRTIDLFSGIVAQSPTDAGVVDATCKNFAGTVVLQTAELSGVTSNQNNEPVEARVFTDVIDLDTNAPLNTNPDFFNANRRIEINRDGAPFESGTYTVRHVYDNVSSATGNIVDTVVLGNETDLSADDLRNYDTFGTTMFPQIAVAGEGREGFSLLTDSSDVQNPERERATYTLPEVPAENGPPAFDDTEITPTGFDSNLNSGTAVATGVQINRTSTANIEITSNIDFQVTSLDAPINVTSGETFDVTAEITNEGGVTDQQNIQYELVDDDTGTTNESLVEEDIVLGGGESTTVTFTVDTGASGIGTGNFTNVVTTEDDTASTPTEIVTDGTGGNGDSPIDGVSDSLWNAVTQGDGDLSLGDLGTAITEYQDDGQIGGEPIGLGQLGDLISYYQNEVA